MITQKILHDLFEYDGKNLIWKVAPNNRIKIGDVAGSIGAGGYRRTNVSGTHYRMHRLIWMHVYGEFPENEIDHIDGNPLNNRIENLRDVRHLINMQNQKLRGSNSSGITGVYWRRDNKKWHVRIKIDYKYIHLCYADNLLDAACARKSAEIEHGFHENHGRQA